MIEETTVRILRDIKERGLFVLHRFGSVYAYFGHEYDNDNDEMPKIDYWHIVTQKQFIKVEGVSMGDYFEEFVGLLFRYTLTDKGLEIANGTLTT